MSLARNLARLVVDNAGALAAENLTNAPNPILPGTIAYVGMNSTPTGWLKANGAAVSRTTYAALFAAIGTTYGAGDGSTTFNLPDLRGEFPRGWDDGRGVDSGRSIGTAQDDAFKSHSHATRWWPSGGTATITYPGLPGHSGGSTTNSGHRNQSEGGDETRPRNIALLACIKF
jgi:phage-related tail fiber protein